MYQLSRLLHDYYKDLYGHLERHEIVPTFYAAPWFLTLFASQFPLGFVARVFGGLPMMCRFIAKKSFHCPDPRLNDKKQPVVHMQAGPIHHSFSLSDLIFLQGTEVIYKVALILLGNHKELIMQCNSFETIVEFLKTTLPEMGIIQMERIINQVRNFIWI